MAFLSLCLLSWAILCLAAVSYSVYVLRFHPYAKYPGPLLARLTPLHSLWHAYIGDLHLDVLHCHEVYGDIVRYGPNRLLINRPEAVRAIYGQGKNFKKSSAYAPHPFFPAVFNTHNCIEPSQHGRKRRIVAQAFSEGSLSAYEPSIIEQVDALCTALASDIGSDGWSQPKDMADWTNYFTLDVISILTFGSCFNLLGNPRLRWLLQAIVQGNRHIYLRFAFPLLFNLNPEAWYAPAHWLFPDLARERDAFVKVANEMTFKRSNATSNFFSPSKDHKPRRDIISELEKAHDPKTNSSLSAAEIASEAHLMIAAGGDTTSTALSAVLFYLSRSPTSYTILTSEIRTLFTDISQIRRGPRLSSARYLRACIDEALRLAPAAPGALWRQAGLYGAFVEEVFVPRGLEVGTCVYALSHDARYFHQPFEFRPERWLGRERDESVSVSASPAATPTKEKQEFVHEIPDVSVSTRSKCYSDVSFFPHTEQKTPRSTSQNTTTNNTPQQQYHYQSQHLDTLSASTPFSIGPRSCLAKPLAYLELSLALARLVYIFDFEAVDDTGCGGRWSGWWGNGRGRERVDEFQIIDMFSSNKEGPVLRLRRWERPSGE